MNEHSTHIMQLHYRVGRVLSVPVRAELSVEDGVQISCRDTIGVSVTLRRQSGNCIEAVSLH